MSFWSFAIILNYSAFQSLYIFSKRLSRPQNFCLTFFKELKNQLKNCWSGPIKNVRILIFTKMIKQNTWRYHYFTPVYQKSWWYDLQFLRYRVWQTEIGNYESFSALRPQFVDTLFIVRLRLNMSMRRAVIINY